MNLLEEIPEPVESRLRNVLDSDEKPRLAVSSDINKSGLYGDCWLIATEKRLVIVSSNGQAAPAPASAETLPAPTKDGQTTLPVPAAQYPVLTEVPLETISEVETRDFVGNGALEVKTGESTIEAVRFSRSLTDKFVEVATAIEDLVKEVVPEEARPAPPEGEEQKRRLKPSPKPRCENCGRALPPHSEICPACLKKGKLIMRLLVYVKPYWKASVASLFLTLGLTVIGLTPPKLTQMLIDDVLNFNKPMAEAVRLNGLMKIVGFLMLLYILRAVIQGARTLLTSWLGLSIMYDLRTQIYQHVQQLSMSFYDKRRVGGIMSRITNDTSVMHGFATDGVQSFIINILTLIGIGIILLRMNWQLALLVLIPTPLLAAGTIIFGRMIHRVWRRYWRQISSINSTLASTISGARVVKCFAQEGREVDRFKNKSRDFMQTSMTANKMYTAYYPLMGFISSIGSIIIWGVGGRQVIGHSLSLGELIAFTAYMWQFYSPIDMLCNLNNTLQQVATAAERVFEVLDAQPEIRDAPDAVEIPRIEGDVVFEDVTFNYEGNESNEPVLKNINLHANPGELIGLVGHSGSGKSTLVNLLLRFYDPDEGKVTVDGIDVRQLKLKSLRSQIGMVLQEPFLFAGTIAENIAYGRPGASREEIMEAARAANAHQFIMNFPDGYDTEVGERGVRLSGGEKQRISIARAILNNPRLLILDEATSAVDTETEALIQEALERLMKGRTSFAIAHRLSTLKNADKLVVLDKGRIVEEGTHEELLAKEDGVYHRLCKIQTELSKTVVV
ncbi:MAG: ABC transporter ATP-binding protein [Armatimonadetes bacterium]|nr:ABC transporter ATP-binding protein [Armatimonadota bacterium]